MIYEFTDQQLGGVFRMNDEIHRWQDIATSNDLIHIIWNKGKKAYAITIDDVPISLPPCSLLTVTYYHHVALPKDENNLVAFSFNREFYCIQDHDAEVSCNGVIFFGTQDVPVINLDEENAKKFNLLQQVFEDEFQTKDVIQGEMLRMLLKRLIILCTRLTKQQQGLNKLGNSQLELVRQFNVLVDHNYREKKNVSDYADLLNKSPKTLANLFKQHNQKTPLQMIHERIVLEARRLLTYTDKSVKEIAYDLGFDELATFFKIFKKQMNITPQQFRETLKISA